MMNKADFEQQVEAAYLCGYSIREIPPLLQILNKRTCSLGAANRIVTSRKVETVKAAGVYARVARLLQIEAEESDYNGGMVEQIAKMASLRGSAEIRAAPGGRGMALQASVDRVELLRSLTEARGCPPERAWRPVQRPRSTVVHNVADCGLQWLNSRGALPDWAYDAGLRLRNDYGASQVGGMAGVDPAKEAVDGGLPAGQRDHALDAMQRITACRKAVFHAFGWVYCPPRVVATGQRSVLQSGRGETVAVVHYPDEAEKRWGWIGRIAIHGDKIRAHETGAWGVTGAWLAESLEPVAWVYQMAPGGTQISKRMQAWSG